MRTLPTPNLTESEFFCSWQSPLGLIQLTATNAGLTSLSFTTSPPLPFSLNRPNEILLSTIKWLEAYFKGTPPDVSSLALAPRGTPFQQRVWAEVKRIKYGALSSYGNIAKTLGINSARAVGGAISRNPIALIIPCHRVVMSNGQLCGYAWGAPIKRSLLHHEGIKLKPTGIKGKGKLTN